MIKKYNIHFKYTSIYVIGKSGNLSIGAPFCRDCPNRTINIIDSNNKRKGPTLSLEQIDCFNHIDNINTLLQFNSIYSDLYSVIFAKQLGNGNDINIKTKLDNLKLRIIHNLKNEEKKDFQNKWNLLNDMAENGTHNYDIGTAGISIY